MTNMRIKVRTELRFFYALIVLSLVFLAASWLPASAQRQADVLRFAEGVPQASVYAHQQLDGKPYVSAGALYRVYKRVREMRARAGGPGDVKTNGKGLAGRLFT